jgi:hypothetical protein
VGGVGAPYRYRLQLVPRDHSEGATDAGEALAEANQSEARSAPGWEFVSSRTTGEGDELTMFRQVVSKERVS